MNRELIEVVFKKKQESLSQNEQSPGSHHLGSNPTL